MRIRKSLLGLTAGAMALVGAAPVAVAGEFDGVTVNILTRPGYVIAGRLVERGVEFQEATGAKVVVTEVPYAEIFPKIQSDWSTGTNSIDVGVFDADDASGLQLWLQPDDADTWPPVWDMLINADGRPEARPHKVA